MTDREHNKGGFMLANLATGVYRKWYWANYKAKPQQDILREHYQKFLEDFKLSEIRSGLREWASVNGVDNPPTPDVFKQFLDSKRRLAKAKIKQLREVLHG